MEAVLKKAAERMPLPHTEFDEIAGRLQKQERRPAHPKRLQPVLAALVVLFLLAGCATAYGAYRASRGTRILWSSDFLVDARLEMEKYGVKLPEEFDGCPFWEMSVGSSVPHDISYVEAIFYGYKSVDASYGGEELCYRVAVGDTKDGYWVTFFKYESEDTWRGDGDYLAVEYGGYTIHTGYYLNEDNKTLKATWVDPERQICVSVHGSDGRDPLPLAKWIIDNME